ncbi:hypothetical protein PMAYCL1PPCAC_14594, partial [Pristionchus mayeri]
SLSYLSRMSNRNRRSKKDVIVINDGESTNNQLTGKIVKREPESDPAIEVIELRKKLADLTKEMDEKSAKWEDMYQRAIREAGKYLARVEFLEGLVDKKPVIVDHSEKVKELEEKVSYLTKELDEERRGSRDRMETLKCMVAQYEMGLPQPQENSAASGEADLRREEEDVSVMDTDENLSKKGKRNEVMEENVR